ncbi:MAG: tetratricopeptide repeat protein [Candidatus Omnitrophica bacterium]|nr:tetratricopeptide repeat protein [Candidatus Omnitrophota bacterium]
MHRPFALLIILLLIAVCYGQCLFFDFLNWDDPSHFLDNPSVQSLSPKNILEIFRTTVDQIYIPLSVLSHAVEHHFFSFNPMIYHFHNILLHIGVTILVFFFGRQCGLTENASLIAALIFGIHPMHVESVTWVTERKGMLYALLYMASLCAYGSYLKRKKFTLYGISLLCGILSILAKPTALSLPLVLFVCDWIHNRKINIRILAEKLPFFLYSGAIAWITFVLVYNRIPVENFSKGALVWIWTFSFYIFQFFLPSRLSLIYPIPEPISLGNPAYLFSVILVAILAGGLMILKSRRWHMIALLLYFFQIFFLLRFNDKTGVNVVADRFMYLPSLGFCLLLGYLFDSLITASNDPEHFRQNKAAKAAVILYLGALSIMTFIQVQVWKNDMTLWSSVLRINPHCDIAYHNRGYAFMQKGQYALALSDFQRALDLNPRRPETYNNRGMIFAKLGQSQKALAEFEKALLIQPGSSAVFINRGNLYRDEGKLSGAIKEYDRVLHLPETDPLMRALAYAEKAYALYLKEDPAAALQHIGQALAIFPDLDKALKYRALINR